MGIDLFQKINCPSEHLEPLNSLNMDFDLEIFTIFKETEISEHF